MAFDVLIVDDGRAVSTLRVISSNGRASASWAWPRRQRRRCGGQPSFTRTSCSSTSRSPGESGFELARQLSAPDKGAAALILISTHSRADFADLVAESPAAGFLPKSELSADAIRRIASGNGPGGGTR